MNIPNPMNKMNNMMNTMKINITNMRMVDMINPRCKVNNMKIITMKIRKASTKINATKENTMKKAQNVSSKPNFWKVNANETKLMKMR